MSVNIQQYVLWATRGWFGIRVSPFSLDGLTRTIQPGGLRAEHSARSRYVCKSIQLKPLQQRLPDTHGLSGAFRGVPRVSTRFGIRP